MKTSRTAEVLPENVNSVQALTRKKVRFSPRLFKHTTLFNDLGKAQKMDLEGLNNLLNSIHFAGESLYALLRHPRYEENILVKAYPDPSLDGTLTCRWADEHLSSSLPGNSEFLYLIIDFGRAIVLVQASLVKMRLDSFSVQLPETSHVVNQRRIKRYVTQDVAVDLIHDGFKAGGELVDFSPHSFRVRVNHDPSGSLECLGLDVPVTIHLHRGETVLFSGPCRCIRQEVGLKGKDIVFVHADKKPVRSEKKRIRNPRQRLVPSPTLIFEHPFLRKKKQLDVTDLSTSGFCVYEDPDEGILMKDLVIPELLIDFAGGLRLKCAAEVIYRLEEKGNGIRCGLTILDMDIDNYSRFTHVLTKALDPHAHIYNDVDMDALWEFFFNAGFIYPKKYSAIHSHREKFKEIYKKLYHENPDIARHIIYQKNGRVFGHMSMVRAYEKSWMIHHHAARAMADKRAGFNVLKQFLHYLKDMCRLASTKTDYIFCYFRPESKFPERIYGGFAKALNNSRKCSLDLFSYLFYSSLSSGGELPESWSLRKCTKQDQWELSRFYNHHSGGLLLDILYPRNKKENDDETVENLYNRVGLMRKWRSYSLKLKGKLKAVLIVNQSNFGLNLSELLNGIKIIVTDSEGLPWEILSIAINQLTKFYQTEKVPLLIYPNDYIETKNVHNDAKKYTLFALDARLISELVAFVSRRFRICYWD